MQPAFVDSADLGMHREAVVLLRGGLGSSVGAVEVCVPWACKWRWGESSEYLGAETHPVGSVMNTLEWSPWGL